jgi:hypothetical protein
MVLRGSFTTSARAPIRVSSPAQPQFTRAQLRVASVVCSSTSDTRAVLDAESECPAGDRRVIRSGDELEAGLAILRDV